MKKRVLSFVLLLTMAFGGGGVFAGTADVEMVPLRETAESLGYTVTKILRKEAATFMCAEELRAL